MKLIVSHTSPDFDALASMALAQLVHPGAKAVLLGGLGTQTEALLHLYRDELELLSADRIDLAEVAELIVVDTSEPSRIAPFDQLLGKVPVTLYDHHPRPEQVIPAVHGIHREVGATASILSLLLKTRGIPIPQAIASLALLGIHDDTGNLTYELTHPEDHEAAAHLLREGASLELLHHFVHEQYSETHRELFAQMLAGAEVHDLLSRTVVISEIETDAYVYGLAPLCNQLLTFYNADAAFIVAALEDKTLIIGRSAGLFDVGAALADIFDGGGHAGAGFAKTELAFVQVKDRLLRQLPNYGQRPVLARDVMTRGVNTVQAEATVAEAQSRLLRFGHNGLPVINEQAKLVGIVSRRNLEKALQHDMSQAPVKAVMIKKVITANEESSLTELETLIENHNVGRIPIVKENRVVGIVSRSDIIRARHQNRQPASGHTLAAELLSRLPHAARKVLELAKTKLEHGSLYLVGGTVRDAFLGVSMQDLDISVEGSRAETLGQRLAEVLGGDLTYHEDFSTCTLRLENGLTIDIATARDEYYTYPGALPEVSPSNLHKDIERRDFSINALAIRVYPEPLSLIDPYGGLKDLDAKCLRNLHPLSFIEDPSRILRGARLAGRLNLHFEEDTLEQLKLALSHEALARISKARLRAELELTLQETKVAPALKKLAETGALEAIFGFEFDEDLLTQLDAERFRTEVPGESYVLALLLATPDDRLKTILEGFHWPRRYLDMLKRIKTIRQADDVTHEQLSAMTGAEFALLRVFSRKLAAQVFDFQTTKDKPIVRGRDLLELGLSPGPEVGEVLDQLAKARHNGEVESFEEELELARQLIAKQR